jgi:hypothetical protein
MNIYTIVLKRLSAGEQSISFLTRQETEEAARAYAEAAIANDLDLSVAEIRTPVVTEHLEARSTDATGPALTGAAPVVANPPPN